MQQFGQQSFLYRRHQRVVIEGQAHPRKLYDGLRQDSGDPLVWADKVLARYAHLGIDPMTR